MSSRFLVPAVLLIASSCAPLGAFLPGPTANPSDPQAVRSYLEATNLDSAHFPWVPGVAHGRLKRWDIEGEGPIPVQLNGSALAEHAIATIEARLGMTLFETSSIAGAADAGIVRGIVVTEGTAVGPAGRVTSGTCGNVSRLPGATDYPAHFYDDTGRISARLYVNLSSPKCSASLEVAIHEFGHALGLGPHFPDFPSADAPIGPAFWQVLANLYVNEVGVSNDRLQVRTLDQ